MEVSHDSSSLIDLDGTLLDRRQSLEQFIHDQYNRFSLHFINIEQAEYCSRFLELDNNGYYVER